MAFQRMDQAGATRIATAAGQDAANRHMRRHGRTAWSEDDRDVALDATYAVLAALGFSHIIPSETSG